MTNKEFNEILNLRIEKIKQVLSSKAIEYASDKDRLYNFKRASEIMHVTPEKSCWAFLNKHLVSVIDIVEGIPEQKYSLSYIDEKLGDLINYLCLLEAILVERIHNEK